jgi:putative transposon-encoded protein
MANSKRRTETTSEKLMSIGVEGYEAIEKIVRSAGNSGRVYLPPSWINCRVKIIRLDPLPEIEKGDS